MFIADVSFERPDKKEGDKYRYVKIGSLWHDAGDGKASVLLYAVRVGSFVARPRRQEEAPYLEGDMCVRTGTYEENGHTKGKYMPIGYIQTKEGQGGITYFGQILSDPSPVLIGARVKDLIRAMTQAKSSGKHFDLDTFNMNGIFIPIFLSDRQAKEQKEEQHVADDNLPF